MTIPSAFENCDVLLGWDIDTAAIVCEALVYVNAQMFRPLEREIIAQAVADLNLKIAQHVRATGATVVPGVDVSEPAGDVEASTSCWACGGPTPCPHVVIDDVYGETHPTAGVPWL